MYGEYGADSERPSACKFYYVSPLAVKRGGSRAEGKSSKAEGKSKVQNFTFAFCLLPFNFKPAVTAECARA
jgi:hypothetical protein